MRLSTGPNWSCPSLFPFFFFVVELSVQLYVFFRSFVRPPVDGVCNEKVGVVSVGYFSLLAYSLFSFLRWRIGHEGFSLCWTRGPGCPLNWNLVLPPFAVLCSHLFFFCVYIYIYLSISGISLSAVFCLCGRRWEKRIQIADSGCVRMCGSLFFCFFPFCYLLFRLTFLSVRRTSCFSLSFLSLSTHYVYQQGRKAVLQQPLPPPQQQQRRLSSGRSAPKCWESDRTRSASASWRSWNNK